MMPDDLSAWKKSVRRRATEKYGSVLGLAEAIDRHPQSLYRLLNGKGEPGWGTVVEIEGALRGL